MRRPSPYETVSQLVNLGLYRSSCNESSDGVHRWSLSRTWRTKGQLPDPLTFVMLNPSVADGRRDDPTIRKCVGFALRLGYNGIEVVNQRSFRATDPRYVPPNSEFEFAANHAYVAAALEGARATGGAVVVAWGHRGDHNLAKHVFDVAREVGVLDQVHCIRKTAKGYPIHPLMVPYGSLYRYFPWEHPGVPVLDLQSVVERVLREGVQIS